VVYVGAGGGGGGGRGRIRINWYKTKFSQPSLTTSGVTSTGTISPL
jgi:hypothetical protein